jgi:hypothetical protein
MQVFNDLNELSNSSGTTGVHWLRCPDLRFAGRIEPNVGSEPQAGETHSKVHAACCHLRFRYVVEKFELRRDQFKVSC